MPEYTLTESVYEVAMSEALQCMDVEGCRAACRQCPRYATSWACPPFDLYRFRALQPEHFATLRIIVYTMEFTKSATTLDEARRWFNDEMRRFMPGVRQEAERLNGTVYGFACSCELCDAPCTRPEGKPCRHPHAAGPSLEAVGFDVARLLERFCHRTLDWSPDGTHVPQRLTYVAAIALPV